MMPQHFKKTFSIAIFSFIFFSSFLVNIANAEVTCCACTGHRISYSGERGGMRGTSGIDAVEFSCAEGNPGCETICDRDNAGWRALEEHATGEVVTCCKCRDDTRVCANVNQTCSSEALCGTTPGFMSGGMWKREPGGEINASAETTKDEASKVELIPPNLNIDIPGAGNLFGGGQIVTEGEERYFYLPYIGEYVSALYNYVLGIVGILAVVVIIFAGGIWLTAGGSPERIKTAQEYIFGAVTGVVLAFGSYLILYTINPDLVRFDAMKVKVVERINFEFAFVLATTEANTMEQDGNTTFVTSINTDEYESRFTSCPFTLPAPLTNPTRDQINFNPRTIAFIENIMPILRETTVTGKIAEIADAAIKCQVEFGSCGRTTSVIRKLAVSGLESGLACYRTLNSEGLRTLCNVPMQQEGISSELRTWMRSVACCPGSSVCRSSPSPSCCNPSSGCTSNPEEAKRIVRERFDQELESQGWPDEWLNQLQPGNEVYFYNGNTSYGGSHSITFMGWQDTNGHALIIESGAEEPIRAGVRCIKNSCGNDAIPTFYFSLRQ